MPATTPHIINLVPVTSLDIESQMKVMEIRNEATVRKWMFTDHMIGPNEHLAWISRLKQDDKQIVFVALDMQKNPLGVASVNAIDSLHRKADWGYYLTDSARSGLGPSLELSIIEFIFNELKVEKLNCEVIEGNDTVVKLHKKFLFKEEGFRRSNILKNGCRTGVHLLGLTREDWLAGKKKLQEKYKRIFEKFSLAIQWQPTCHHPIDQIEAARARNNINWMNILRLALEKSPRTAKPIVAEIKRIDREISLLADKLTE